jgi:predicted RND superfamily exporter protein
MTEEAYKNRELDSKFEEVHGRLDTQDASLAKILTQTTATNGKVRKIIIALVALLAFVLGLQGKEIIPLLTKLLI